MGRLRREMNGAVVEAMEQAGIKGVLNYGVSIPTIRAIAKEEGKDYDFAKFLYVQQVRELRMAAINIAEPERVECEDLNLWLGSKPTLELLDELALRLLSKCSKGVIEYIAREWLCGDDRLAIYTALRVLTRANDVDFGELSLATKGILSRFGDDIDLARAVLSLYTMRLQGKALGELPETRAAEFVRREYNALFG